MTSIKEIMEKSYANAVAKGFYEQEGTVEGRICLMHSELSEALEEYRNNHPVNECRIENGKPEGVGIELADTVIRICDFCQHYGIDLEEAIVTKMAYNATRPHKHGGKKI